MLHCVLITAYKDVAQVNRLISRLPEDWGVFIHVDKKSDLNVSLIDKRAVIMPRRTIFWGSFEHVLAFLDMMKQAFASDAKYDYFHLITAQDYPSCDLAKADELCADGRLYLEYFSLPHDPDWWEDGHAFFKYKMPARFMDLHSSNSGVWIAKFCRFVQKWKSPSLYLPSYPLFGSTIYCSLPRDAVEFVFRSEVMRDLSESLINSLVGEEVFFQTIFMNSSFADRVANNNLRFIDWNSVPCPRTLVVKDFEDIFKSKTLFCRKLDSVLSASLMDKLDEAK